MSKAVLISIRPEWCDKIASGQKTIEVRKTRPKIETPFKCYIYETKAINHHSILVDLDGEQRTIFEKGRGKIIGEFICDRIVKAECGQYCRFLSTLKTQILPQELFNYANYKPVYGWHISNLVIYDKPKELSEFFVIDKKAVKKCSLRERIYTNPDYTNGVCLPGTYICNKDPVDIDFCRGGCWKKSLSLPPQSWCYVSG
nr:hypothetical protein [uncultured Ruminococcus sp.]